MDELSADMLCCLHAAAAAAAAALTQILDFGLAKVVRRKYRNVSEAYR
jgi:hypothetical protein